MYTKILTLLQIPPKRSEQPQCGWNYATLRLFCFAFAESKPTARSCDGVERQELVR